MNMLFTTAAASALAPCAATALEFDPIFALIETHRQAEAGHIAALAEQTRLELIGDPLAPWVASEPCYAAMEAFKELIATAPATPAGLRAWAAYLGEISDRGDGWMFEEEGPTLVTTFAEAFGNVAGAV